jgi:hypothetical protein
MAGISAVPLKKYFTGKISSSAMSEWTMILAALLPDR